MTTYHIHIFSKQMPLNSLLHVSLSNEVLNRLTTFIEDGSVKKGDFLPAERELAAQLGVSRVVVREAAKRLEQRGLISIRQGVGVQVINNPSLPIQQAIHRMLPSDGERLRQSAQARLLIEPEIAALATVNCTPVRLVRIQATCEAMDAEDDLSVVAGLDIAFHETIAAVAGNKVFELMMQSIAELGRLNREVTLAKVGKKRALDHHRDICAAIGSGDPAKARRSMRRHLEAALNDLF